MNRQEAAKDKDYTHDGQHSRRKKCSNTEFRQGILLLPIDILFGWIFTNDKRQRLLSKAGYTIVIKVQEEDTKWSYTKCQTQKGVMSPCEERIHNLNFRSSAFCCGHSNCSRMGRFFCWFIY